MSSQDRIVDLFAEYIRLRKATQTPQDSWRALYPHANDIGAQDVQRLLALLRGWEAREGRQHQPANDLERTPQQPSERVDRVRASARDAYERKRHLIRRISFEAASHPQAQEIDAGLLCPACFQSNRPGELYCAHCGCLLDTSTTGSHRPGATRPIDHPPSHSTHFEDGMAVLLKIRGATGPMSIVPRRDVETVLGRASADSVVMPDIDLAPYNAQSFGVSRLHAGLQRQGDTIVLSDLGSLNYTFINGQRLHAHETRVLCDGDQIRLGHLTIQVFFNQQG